MDLGCTFKLAEDADRSAPHRTAEITISVDGESRSGKWKLVDDSSDSRVTVGNSNGIWFLANGSDDDGDTATLYVARPSDQRILFELYGVNRKTLSMMSCGSGFGGNGWHQGPPKSNIVFSLWYGCA